MHHPYTEAGSYRYKSFVDEVFHNDADTFCHVSLGCFDMDFWTLWYFVWSGDTGEFWGVMRGRTIL